MAEAQLQQFLEKVRQLNAFVALSETDPRLRSELRDCDHHDQVVALARRCGFEIGRRWGEPRAHVPADAAVDAAVNPATGGTAVSAADAAPGSIDSTGVSSDLGSAAQPPPGPPAAGQWFPEHAAAHADIAVAASHRPGLSAVTEPGASAATLITNAVSQQPAATAHDTATLTAAPTGPVVDRGRPGERMPLASGLFEPPQAAPVQLAQPLAMVVGHDPGCSLLGGPCPPPGEERTQILLQTPQWRLERIHSCAAVSPPDFWYEQAECEWLTLLQGNGRLRFADEDRDRCLRRGDSLLIREGRRHRVTASDPAPGTIWLALFWQRA